ncbi:hypothetical protein CEXT_18481 [Caerostris extrusa]|uniref:Uncharacterized protein n=1 Tax=Caerostris extrusa TaxID=172846 RepID=A0AAV4UDS4_CAEEX|nr:hypothetical protein CEXT_18481 [Caerostris extrusa]
MVQGTPPTPSPVSATGNQQSHQLNNNQLNSNNLNNFNPDAASKAIFVLNELINIFSSMGGLDMYAALSSVKNPLEKLASVLSVI